MSGREEGICSYLTLTGLALPERAILALFQNKSVSELPCLQINLKLLVCSADEPILTGVSVLSS